MIPRAASSYSRKELTSMFKAFSKSYNEILKELREIFHERLGLKNVFFYNSGTTALYMALKALNFREGEVIVPAYTCGSVVKAVLMAGYKPVLVDVDLQTFNLSLTEFRKAISKNTKVVIPAYMFGNPIDYYALKDIAEKYGLYVIEDAAQALGAKYDGKYVGSFGDVAIFSFGLGKGISGGGGGALVVNNDELDDRIKEYWADLKKPNIGEDFSVLLKNFSMYIFSSKISYRVIRSYIEKSTIDTDYRLLKSIFKLLSGHESKKANKLYRISKFSAAIVYSQILKLEKIINKRRKNAEFFKANLDLNNAIIQKEPKMARHAYSRFGLIVYGVERNRLRREMARKGVDTEEMYSYMKKIYEKLAKYPLPNSYLLTDKLLCLPVHVKLSNKDLDFIVSRFNEIVNPRIH